MVGAHFLMKTLPKVASEMALSALAYNLTRVVALRYRFQCVILHRRTGQLQFNPAHSITNKYLRSARFSKPGFSLASCLKYPPGLAIRIRTHLGALQESARSGADLG